MPVEDVRDDAVIAASAAAFEQAIAALRCDEIEAAADLFADIERVIGCMSASPPSNVHLSMLQELWEQAQTEAAACADRLQTRASQQGASQRAARAYR